MKDNKRLDEVKKEIDEIRTERLNLWTQEDKIKERHQVLQKRNNELFTEYLQLNMLIPIPKGNNCP